MRRSECGCGAATPPRGSRGYPVPGFGGPGVVVVVVAVVVVAVVVVLLHPGACPAHAL